MGIRDKLTLRTKTAFGLGQVVEITKIWAFETLVLFYYSQVLGLPAALAGAALLLVMLVDAVTDPWVGRLSDNSHRARWGHRHTYMFLSLVPSAVFFLLLFRVPEGLPQIGLFCWLLVMSIGLRVSLTFYAIPYSAQLADLTSRRDQRGDAAAVRMLLGAAARFLLIYLAFNVFFQSRPGFQRGQEDPSAYLPIAATGAALILVFGLLSALGTRRALQECEPERHHAAAREPATLAALLRFWVEVFSRPGNVRVIILYSVLMAAFTGIYGSLNIYLGSYYWALSAAQLGYWNQAMIPGMVIMLLASAWLLRIAEPKRLMLGALLLYFISHLTPLVLAESGLIDRTGELTLNLLYATKFTSGLAFGTLIVCVPVMAAEVADQEYSLRGIGVAGLLFGLLFFATKAGNGIGGMLAGGGLSLIDFARVSPDSLPSGATLTRLAWFVIVSIVISGAMLLALIARGYRLTRSDHNEIVRGIETPAAKAVSS